MTCSKSKKWLILIMTCSKSAKCKFSKMGIHGEWLIFFWLVNYLLSAVSFPAKKNESQKEYMEMGRYFHLGAHLKCAGTVTFILLLLYTFIHSIDISDIFMSGSYLFITTNRKFFLRE